jgi:hypothetical protein
MIMQKVLARIELAIDVPPIVDKVLKRLQDIPTEDLHKQVTDMQDSGKRGFAIMQSLKHILKGFKGLQMRQSLNSVLLFNVSYDAVLQALTNDDYVPFTKLYPAYKKLKDFLVNPRKGIVLSPSQIVVSGKEAIKLKHISFEEALEGGEEAHKALNRKPIGKLNLAVLTKLLKHELGDAELVEADVSHDMDSRGTQPYENDEVAYVIYDGLVQYAKDGSVDYGKRGVKPQKETGWIQILIVRDPYRPGKLSAAIIDSDLH